MENLLALDQSLNTTGFAYFENGKLKDCGLFKVNSKLPLPERLGEIWKHLNELSNKYAFERLAFEGIQNQNNNETFKKLAYVQAVIMMWTFFSQIPTKELPPSHWRSILSKKFRVKFGQKRAEQKRNAQKLVYDKMGIEVEEDVADAICIGIAAMNQQKSAF